MIFSLDTPVTIIIKFYVITSLQTPFFTRTKNFTKSQTVTFNNTCNVYIRESETSLTELTFEPRWQQHIFGRSFKYDSNIVKWHKTALLWSPSQRRFRYVLQSCPDWPSQYLDF